MSNYPSVPTRTSVLPDGTALSRYLMTLGESRGDTHKALMVAERWRDTPQVKATLDLQLKAAVAPATTSDATWAGPLAAHGIGSEAFAAPAGRVHSRRAQRQGPTRAVPHACGEGDGHGHRRCLGRGGELHACRRNRRAHRSAARAVAGQAAATAAGGDETGDQAGGRSA
jgi:hypothetical protein